MGDVLIDFFFITGIVLLSGIHISSFKETFFHALWTFRV